MYTLCYFGLQHGDMDVTVRESYAENDVYRLKIGPPNFGGVEFGLSIKQLHQIIDTVNEYFTAIEQAEEEEAA